MLLVLAGTRPLAPVRPLQARYVATPLALLPARFAASAATTTAAAVATEAAAPAAESTFGLGPRFVDGERPATHLILVEFGRGLLRFLVSRHLDERETACPSGRRVAHHAHGFDVAGLAEQLLQLRLARGVRKVPDIQPAPHTDSSLTGWLARRLGKSVEERTSQTEARSALGAGKAGGADHQKRVVYSTHARTRK